jgi:hypothetical protein
VFQTAIIAGFIVNVAGNRDTPVAIAIAALRLMPVLALLALVLRLMRRVTLTSSELRIPRRLKTISIPVADVAGVGLLYLVYPMGQARWAPYAWRQDGSRERVGTTSVRAVSTWMGGKRPSYPMTRKDPRTWLAESAESVGSSHGARMTRQLYERVLAIQGPGGSLGTQQLQRYVKLNYAEVPRVTAYWSPDGQIGLAEGAHESAGR